MVGYSLVSANFLPGHLTNSVSEGKPPSNTAAMRCSLPIKCMDLKGWWSMVRLDVRAICCEIYFSACYRMVWWKESDTSSFQQRSCSPIESFGYAILDRSLNLQRRWKNVGKGLDFGFQNSSDLFSCRRKYRQRYEVFLTLPKVYKTHSS